MLGAAGDVVPGSVAGGFVADGEIHRGSHGLAGEIGHTIVHHNGRKPRGQNK